MTFDFNYGTRTLTPGRCAIGLFRKLMRIMSSLASMLHIILLQQLLKRHFSSLVSNCVRLPYCAMRSGELDLPDRKYIFYCNVTV